MAMTPTTRARARLLERHPGTRRYAATTRWVLYLVVSCLVTISLWTAAVLSDSVDDLGRDLGVFRLFLLLAGLGWICAVRASEPERAAVEVFRSSENRNLEVVRT
jgi:hypothetical protein